MAKKFILSMTYGEIEDTDKINPMTIEAKDGTHTVPLLTFDGNQSAQVIDAFQKFMRKVVEDRKIELTPH